MEGFIYPNEGILQWGLLIVLYPYITGLVAGAFVVSSLYHVFGLTSLRPVAKFSLLTALAFLIAAPLPLLVHAGRPERAWMEMFRTPHLTSAMSAFGYVWLAYFLILLLEIWLVFRPDIIRYAQREGGIKRKIYSALTLGVDDISEGTVAVDRKLVKVLSAIGIPAACLLHGYAGFIFGAVKANPWWSSPLMPVIFLVSAVVSGIALLIVLYALVCKIRKVPLDHHCLHVLVLWLGGFLTLNVVLEGLEVVGMLYESEESWPIIAQLISGKLAISYLGVQFALGSIVPLVILAVAVLSKFRQEAKTFLAVMASALILIGVFAMRWNVVIGGQLMSKSLRGFTSYSPPVLGVDGIIVGVILLALPLALAAVLFYLLPPWEEQVETSRR